MSIIKKLHKIKDYSNYDFNKLHNNIEIIDHVLMSNDFNLLKKILKGNNNIVLDNLNIYGQNKLYKFIVENNYKVIKLILDYDCHTLGVPLYDVIDESNNHLLSYVIKNNNNKLLEFFKLSNLFHLNNKQESLLLLAISYKNYKACKFLIENNPSLLNYTNKNNETILHYSILYFDKQIFDLLINQNLKIYNVKDNELNLTPLLFACVIKHKYVIEKLVSKSNVNITDINGRSCLYYLIHNDDLFDLVIKTFDNYNSFDNDGNTLAHYMLKKHVYNKHIIDVLKKTNNVKNKENKYLSDLVDDKHKKYVGEKYKEIINPTFELSGKNILHNYTASYLDIICGLIYLKNKHNIIININKNNLYSKNKNEYDTMGLGFINNKLYFNGITPKNNSIIPLIISNNGKMHMNVLFVNDKEVERFDNLSLTLPKEFNYDIHKLDEELKQYFNGYKYIAPYDYLPQAGISEYTLDISKNKIEHSGFCILWCIIWVDNRLLFNSLSRNELFLRLINMFKEINYKEYINGYVSKLNKIKEDLLNGHTMNDFYNNVGIDKINNQVVKSFE